MQLQKALGLLSLTALFACTFPDVTYKSDAGPDAGVSCQAADTMQGTPCDCATATDYCSQIDGGMATSSCSCALVDVSLECVTNCH